MIRTQWISHRALYRSLERDRRVIFIFLFVLADVPDQELWIQMWGKQLWSRTPVLPLANNKIEVNELTLKILDKKKTTGQSQCKLLVGIKRKEIGRTRQNRRCKVKEKDVVIISTTSSCPNPSVPRGPGSLESTAISFPLGSYSANPHL